MEDRRGIAEENGIGREWSSSLAELVGFRERAIVASTRSRDWAWEILEPLEPSDAGSCLRKSWTARGRDVASGEGVEAAASYDSDLGEWSFSAFYPAGKKLRIPGAVEWKAAGEAVESFI